MIVGSLFSGVGGLDLGLARAGFDHAFLAELDPWRRRVLEAHWPGVRTYPDVRAVAAEPGVDLLAGGFPCQDVSVAGRRAGLAGARSGLFHEFARVADAVRPAWLLIENVPGLLTSNDGRDFGIVLGTLADLGYGVAWRVLDARYFGVAQRRRRVFVVGRAGGDHAAALHALCESCGGHPAASRCAWQDHLRAVGYGAGDARTTGTLTRKIGHGTGQAPDESPYVVQALEAAQGGADDNDAQAGRLLAYTLQGRRGNGGGAISHEETLIPLGVSETQRGELVETPYARSLVGGGGKPGSGYPSVRVGMGVRRLMPVECERLMSWPDQWTAPDGVASADARRYSACGDGVVSNVAEWIGRRMLAVTDA